MAHEINPLQKIRLQGAVQKYNDHAVSVTHNVKASTNVKTIIEMIKLAESVGCKGFTLFRDGSRNPILSRIDNDKKAKKEAYENSSYGYKKFMVTRDATKRPLIINGDVYISTISGCIYAVIIGIYDDKPYEVFTFKPTSGEIKAIKKANDFLIRKDFSKTYSLIIRGDNDNGAWHNAYVIEAFNKRDNDGDNEATCRLISISLRHGIDITHIYEQLIKPNTNINKTYKVLARNFKKYLDNEKLNRKVIMCPECGKGKLIFIEGCVKCNTCGYSKC